MIRRSEALAYWFASGPPKSTSPPRVASCPPGHDGAWRSLVARPLWERKVAGSNPVAPTRSSAHTESRHLRGVPQGRRLLGVLQGRRPRVRQVQAQLVDLRPAATTLRLEPAAGRQAGRRPARPEPRVLGRLAEDVLGVEVLVGGDEDVATGLEDPREQVEVRGR